MKARKLAGITAAAAILLTGCVRSNFTEADLLGQEGISLYVNGEQILLYSPEKYQIGFNPDSREIRVSDDDMADYFILKFSGRLPENEGEQIEADLEYTTTDNLKQKKGIRFCVTRTDEAAGLIWLWDQSGKTGIVLPDMDRLE